MGAVLPMRARLTFAVASTLVLAGCGDARDDFEILKGTLSRMVAGLHPRAEVVAGGDAPRLQASFPKYGSGGLMLLEERRDGVETWISADGATVSTRDGFLEATYGFGSGLLASDIRQSRALIFAGHDGVAERFHSFLNGNDKVELRAYFCAVTHQPREDIEIAGQAQPSRKVEETCYGMGHTFTNTYWLDPYEVRILQSSQWTGDFLGNIDMKVVQK